MIKIRVRNDHTMTLDQKEWKLLKSAFGDEVKVSRGFYKFHLTAKQIIWQIEHLKKKDADLFYGNWYMIYVSEDGTHFMDPVEIKDSSTTSLFEKLCGHREFAQISPLVIGWNHIKGVYVILKNRYTGKVQDKTYKTLKSAIKAAKEK